MDVLLHIFSCLQTQKKKRKVWQPKQQSHNSEKLKLLILKLFFFGKFFALQQGIASHRFLSLFLSLFSSSFHLYTDRSTMGKLLSKSMMAIHQNGREEGSSVDPQPQIQPQVENSGGLNGEKNQRIIITFQCYFLPV